jgi:hypothetical protein
MQHFIKHTSITKGKHVLHLLDNPHSLLDMKILELGKENRAVMSFLRHTSQKLQPLDRSVYGSEVIMGKLRQSTTSHSY